MLSGFGGRLIAVCAAAHLPLQFSECAGSLIPLRGIENGLCVSKGLSL